MALSTPMPNIMAELYDDDSTCSLDNIELQPLGLEAGNMGLAEMGPIKSIVDPTLLKPVNCFIQTEPFDNNEHNVESSAAYIYGAKSKREWNSQGGQTEVETTGRNLTTPSEHQNNNTAKSSVKRKKHNHESEPLSEDQKVRMAIRLKLKLPGKAGPESGVMENPFTKEKFEAEKQKIRQRYAAQASLDRKHAKALCNKEISNISDKFTRGTKTLPYHAFIEEAIDCYLEIEKDPRCLYDDFKRNIIITRYNYFFEFYNIDIFPDVYIPDEMKPLFPGKCYT